MSCPYFKEAYVGVCISSGPPYVPSIAQMEQYCFTDDFRFCPNNNNFIEHLVYSEACGKESDDVKTNLIIKQ